MEHFPFAKSELVENSTKKSAFKLAEIWQFKVSQHLGPIIGMLTLSQPALGWFCREVTDFIACILLLYVLCVQGWSV